MPDGASKMEATEVDKGARKTSLNAMKNMMKDQQNYNVNPAQEDPVVKNFKSLDKDGDLKVSADEYIKAFVKDCLENGYGTNIGQNFADLIAEKYADFKKYAGDDVSMNIDEFRSMVEAPLSIVEENTDNPPTNHR